MTKSTKKFLALILGAVMLLGLFAGCSDETVPEKETTDTKQDFQVSTPYGLLVLSTQASLNINYNQAGMVTEVSGRNDFGIAVAENYKNYAGKSCDTVIKELIAACSKEGYLRDATSIMLKLAFGSQLPSETFLDDLTKTAAAAAAENGSSAPVVAIGLDGLDAEGYINAANAQILLKNALGVSEFDSYNGDTYPRNDCYTVTVRYGDAFGVYDIDAVTGLISEVIEEDNGESEYIEDEFDPSFEEQVEETIEEDVETDIGEEIPEEEVPAE